MRREDLFNTMTQRLEQERQRILEEARVSAESILAENRSQMEKRREEAVHGVHRETEALLEAARERAQAHAALDELAAQQEAVETLLEEIRAGLKRAAADPGFGECIVALLQEALRETPAAAVAMVPAPFRDTCRAWLQREGGREVEVKASDTLTDGIVLSDAAGTFRVTNTLEGRFQRLKPELRRICLRHLMEAAAE